jgi:hypothetical protein
MSKSGTSTRKAIKQIQMHRSSFYKWRFVAELKLVDPSHYHHLAEHFKGTKLRGQNKDSLFEDTNFLRKAEEMRKSSNLIPLSM